VVSVWAFGDGVVASNQPYSAHTWGAAGDFDVVLTAYNDSHPEGVSTTQTVHVVAQPVHYVAVDSANPTPPYTSWETAATVIAGGGAARCVYMTDGAVLCGFTLTGGGTRNDGNLLEQCGGGVWCESTNAVISNCILTVNWASHSCGGANGGMLNNCTLTGNSAGDSCNGAGEATLNNCILYFNYGDPLFSRDWANYQGGTLNYCCTTPLPTDGSADAADPDADGLNNWQEWRCGTCPTNCLSALRLLSAWPTGTNVTVRWQSVAGVSYFLERSANLGSPFTPLATGIAGQAGTASYTDTNAPSLAPVFYRVGVGN
jgi:hypothetical protein